jgi:hypothetical protein
MGIQIFKRPLFASNSEEPGTAKKNYGRFIVKNKLALKRKSKAADGARCPQVSGQHWRMA